VSPYILIDKELEALADPATPLAAQLWCSFS